MGVRTGSRRVALWLAPLAGFIAVVPLFMEDVTVRRHEDLKHVMFGFPLDWLAQDQSALSPPFPHEMSFGSPLENPTNVAFGPLIADLLIVYVVLLAVVLIGRRRSR